MTQETNDNLNYSRWLNLQKVSADSRLTETIEQLLTNLGLDQPRSGKETARTVSNVDSSSIALVGACSSQSSPPPLRVTSRHIDKYRCHCECLLLDLLEAHLVDQQGWIRYSRNESAYRKGTVQNALGISIEVLRKIVEVMKALDPPWIDHYIGYYDKSRKGGKVSRMRMTPFLRQQFGSVEHSWIGHKPIPSKTRVRIKDKDKELLPPSDVTINSLYEWEIQRAQVFANAARIEFGLPDEGWKELRAMMRKGHKLIDMTPTSLYRVFNDGSVSAGGRYYGPWYQNIPSGLRCWFYLNGEPTVELDYKCLHPSMLYAEADEPIPDDCYHLEGYDRGKYRPIIKKALTTFINAKGNQNAVKSLVKRWKEEQGSDSGIRDDKKVWSPIEAKSEAGASRVAESVLSALKDQHPAIADKFCSGEGKRLQNIDAAIAAKILDECAGTECPVMIFHDGFRVALSQSDKVYKLMKSEFRQRFNQDIRVEAKGVTPGFSYPEFSDINQPLLDQMMEIARQ